MNKLLPRTNDLIFKRIFGDYKNKNILKNFLQSILDLPAEEYDKIEVVDPHSKVSIFDDKECILDIKIHTKSKKIIDIEMQVRHSPVMIQRIVYYLADMVKEQLKNGDDYGKLQKVISIIIAANHNLVISDKAYFHKYHLHDKENDKTLTDLMEVNTLELQKLPKKSDNSTLWKWLRFLKTDSEEEIEMLTHGNTAIKEAVCVLKELSEDERTRLLVQSREKFRQDQQAREKEEFQKGLEKGKQEGIAEGMEKGKQEGIAEGMEKGKQEGIAEGIEKGKQEGIAEGIEKGKQEGIAEGIEKGKIDTARNLILLNKLSLEEISEITGLSIQKLKELR